MLHLYNPGVTLFSTVNTVLAGIWLGVAYWKTRSLWLATALHVSWNLAMVFVFGLPVSGLTDYSEMGLLMGRPGSPAWLSGGDYGPEGGAAATLMLLASTFVIWKSGLFGVSPEMKTALIHGSASNEPQIPRTLNGNEPDLP
jgi:membrane protease YdiL (CAAX protease family)